MDDKKEVKHYCGNCFHLVKMFSDPTKGWCGCSVSPFADEDVDFKHSCAFWSVRQPFIWDW